MIYIYKKSLILRYVIRNNVVFILVEVLFGATFNGVQLTLTFLHEPSIARIYSKIVCYISSGSYGVCVQVIQPFLKSTY